MKCLRCDHKKKDHCKGGVSHDSYKFTMRMALDPDPHTCTTKHCLAPLCSCVDYVELPAKPDVAA